MNEHLFDTTKLTGISAAGYSVGNFASIDAFFNSGILAVTFLYALCKFVAFIIDRMRKKDQEKDKEEK